MNDLKTIGLVLIKDIRFWIAVFFIGRLYGITNPPLDGASTWRQTDVLMIARNFYENDPNILYPTLDFAGDESGVVGSEFPLLNYLIFITSLIFGFENWYGRLINLLITSLGTFYFFKSIKKYFGESAAFNSAIVLLCSMWFSYSRNTLPDVFAASLCLISLYFALQYLEEGKAANFIPFLILAMLGCLAKISAAPILTALAAPVLFGDAPMRRKIIFSLGAAIILASVCVWYFFWVPYLNSIGPLGGYYFMGMSFSEGAQDLISKWKDTLNQFLVTPIKYSGLGLLLMSLFLMINKKKWGALFSFGVPLLVYIIFIFKSGRWFYVNDYYPLISVPIFAFAVGFGLDQLKSKKVAIVLLIILCAEGIGNHIHVFEIRPPLSSLIPLEAALDGVTDPKDLIAINSEEGSPTPLFCAHRKGWNVTNKYLAQSENLEQLKNKGCKFIVILKIYGTEIKLNLDSVYDSREFSIYKL